MKQPEKHKKINGGLRQEASPKIMFGKDQFQCYGCAMKTGFPDAAGTRQNFTQYKNLRRRAHLNIVDRPILVRRFTDVVTVENSCRVNTIFRIIFISGFRKAVNTCWCLHCLKHGGRITLVWKEKEEIG